MEKNDFKEKDQMNSTKPILFNTEMVKAILDGRKTQTRRVIPLKNNDLIFTGFVVSSTAKNREGYCAFGKNKDQDLEFIKPKYKVGDILYVRETWCYGRVFGDGCEGDEFWLEQLQEHEDNEIIFYKADMEYAIKEGVSFDDIVWKPSIHMPKKYARIFLKVTNVRVERLQDIRDRDILSEGCNQAIIEKKSNRIEYIFFSKQIKNWWINLWNSTTKDGYKWEDNPYVFVYEFERIKL